MWTEKQIKALRAKNKRYRLTEDAPRGSGRLVLDILTSGQKDFYFQYFFDGSKRYVKVGKFKQSAGDTGLTLTDARAKYREFSDILSQGFDVKTYLDEKILVEKERIRSLKSAKRQGSFRQLIDSYLTNLEQRGKRSHVNVKRSLTRYAIKAFPELMEEKANTIEPSHVSLILRKMIDDGITTHTNRVRSYLHAAFQHGLKEDHNPRRYKNEGVMFNLTSNPVTSVPRQADYERVGNRVLTPEEIEVVWNQLPDYSEVVGLVVRLGLATGIRTGELIRLKKEHIDLSDKTLLIPPEVSKNNMDHLVPLNKLGISTVKQVLKLCKDCEHLFPGWIGASYRKDIHIHSTSVGTKVREFCEDNDDVEKFTPQHDIRRTVKTLMGKAGISKEIRDRIQNHALYDVSSKHYDRYDYLPEKREALKVWNDYLDLIINPDKKVTHISRRKG